MQLYTNNIQDRNGNAIAGAQVLVLKDGGIATIYSDNAGTVTANPTQTDSDGEFRFYAISGRYSLTITSPRLTEAIEFPGIVLFDPDDLGNDLDAIEIVANNIDSVVTVADNISSVLAVAGNEANVNTLAVIDSDITTVATNSTNVTTVAGISANITTVAGISADVTTVAGISSDVTTVATNSANVTTVAANVANIITVSGDIADVTTVATNIADVTALASEIPGFASFAKLDVAQTYTAGQRGEVTALTDGASITPNLADSNFFSVTLGGNRTLENPTNIVAGQSGSIFITQDSGGSKTLAYGSYWDFAGGTAPTLSTTANAVDRLDYVVRTSTSIHAVLTKGWA